jgi:hypothetical protein
VWTHSGPYKIVVVDADTPPGWQPEFTDPFHLPDKVGARFLRICMRRLSHGVKACTYYYIALRLSHGVKACTYYYIALSSFSGQLDGMNFTCALPVRLHLWTEVCMRASVSKSSAHTRSCFRSNDERRARFFRVASGTMYICMYMCLSVCLSFCLHLSVCLTVCLY